MSESKPGDTASVGASNIHPTELTKRSKRVLHAVLITVIAMTAMLAANQVTYGLSDDGVELYALPKQSWGSILSMEWGQWEGTIHICTIEWYQRFNMDSMSYLEPVVVANNTRYYTYYGAIDLAVLPGDEVFFATEGPYGQVMRYENGLMENFTIANMTEHMAFRCIAYREESPFDYFFLGGPDTGLVILQSPWMNYTIRTVSDGLADNTITCLKVRGSTLLVGTSSGFSLYDIASDTLLTRKTDHYDEPFAVNAIEYYPATERIYVGTNQGLLVFERGTDSIGPVEQRFTEQDGLSNRLIYSLELDESRTKLYIGTMAGVSVVDDLEAETQIRPLLTSRHLGNVQVNAILIPTYGNSIFLGTTTDRDGSPRGGLVVVDLDVLSAQGEYIALASNIVASFGFILILLTWVSIPVLNRRDMRKRSDSDIWVIDPAYVADCVDRKIELPLLELKAQINIASELDKRELIRDMMAMANRSLKDQSRGLILVGSKPNGYERHVEFLDGSDYQNIVNSKLRDKIDFVFNEVEWNGKGYGVFIIQPTGSRPIIAKEWIGGDGKTLFKEGECWLRTGTKKDPLNTDELVTLTHDITTAFQKKKP